MNQVYRNVPNDVIERIRDFFVQYPQVAAVYIFGSYGTEFQLPSSDLDVGIVYLHSPDIKEELELDTELSHFLHMDKIDLINLNRAPIGLIYRVLKEGILVLENNYTASSNFIEKAIKHYWDYRIKQQQFMLDYQIAQKEAYNIGR